MYLRAWKVAGMELQYGHLPPEEGMVLGEAQGDCAGLDVYERACFCHIQFGLQNSYGIYKHYTHPRRRTQYKGY